MTKTKCSGELRMLPGWMHCVHGGWPWTWVPGIESKHGDIFNLKKTNASEWMKVFDAVGAEWKGYVLTAKEPKFQPPAPFFLRDAFKRVRKPRVQHLPWGLRQGFLWHGGEFDPKKLKMSNAQGSARGGGGGEGAWAPLELTHTLLSSVYITV